MTNGSLFHDLRGILAAASSNVEFVRTREPASAVAPVLDEIAHELRLVADVIAIIGADDDRVLEVDLRALLLVARGARSFAIDATTPPFPLRAHRSALSAFAAAMIDLSSRGAAIEVSADSCTVRGLNPDRILELCDAAALAEASTVATVEGGSLILRRNH
jgi:hypothetical protein